MSDLFLRLIMLEIFETVLALLLPVVVLIRLSSGFKD